MRLCLFVFENLSGVQLKLYGDVEQLRQKPESALVLANHQSDVDWAVIVMLAQRQGAEGNDAGFRVMVKHVIHYVPLFGWYIFQHGYIYVRRFGEFLSAPVLKQLAWLDTIDEKFWLLVFPEGTRYSLKRKENILVSQEFCRRKGIPEFKNVLSPRAGGAFMALENLESLDAVYDVTIAYGQTRLLDEFHKTGEFPDPVSVNEPAVSLFRTLRPTLFFAAALVAPFYSPTVRNAYFYTMASFPLLILWLEVKKCA
ncbi:Acyltransferase [Ancylostoma duodenale]|uniref:Acyltransferase n=1 Tax=Ancylostoma duodenale TaxID=51022 RepID=A0A0C2G4B2_9BILA|nr:Acyltransferase [Ancylostoma duodenale]